MKRGERAGNGLREVHLPLIVTKADGPYKCRTKEGNHGPTQAHRHSSKSCFNVLRKLVDKENELGMKEIKAKNCKNLHSREKKEPWYQLR